MMSNAKRSSFLGAALLFALGAMCLYPAQAEPIDGETDLDAAPAASDERSRDEAIAGDQRVLAAWTEGISEENPPAQCPSGHLVNGFQCKGDYCDVVRMDCLPVQGRVGSSSWSNFFSEEGSYDWRICGNRGWMTGVACNGAYCDKVSIQCTTIANRTVGACRWSGYFSEEDGPFHAPPGHYIRGVQCKGAYCDDMSFYYCELK